MGILSWIIVGALAGWIASMIMGKNAQMGAMANIIVGIVGGLLGGWVLSIFGMGGMTGINLGSIATAGVGAVIFLAILNMIKKRYSALF